MKSSFSISKRVYLFFREDGFYPLELRDDQDAINNALCNHGTFKVTNPQTGETIWTRVEECQ